MTDKPQLTDDLDLGPGLVVTPGHPVAPKPEAGAPTFSDRVIDHTGKPADHPILSTADKPAAVTTQTAEPTTTEPAATE